MTTLYDLPIEIFYSNILPHLFENVSGKGRLKVIQGVLNVQCKYSRQLEATEIMPLKNVAK